MATLLFRQTLSLCHRDSIKRQVRQWRTLIQQAIGREVSLRADKNNLADDLDDAFDDLEHALDGLDSALDSLDYGLDGLDIVLDSLDYALDGLNDTFDDFDALDDALNDDLRAHHADDK